MRSMTLSRFLLAALASVSVATCCKSDKSTAKTEQPADPASAEGSEGGSTDPAPALPVPRRMRGSESTDGTADDGGPGGWRRERGEMRQRVGEARKRYDTDGDGQLNEDERAAMRHQRLQRQIERIDADHDGKISRDEAEAVPFGGRMLGDFDQTDANQDSFISREELEASMSEREQRRTESWRQRHEEGSAEPTPPAPK